MILGGANICLYFWTMEENQEAIKRGKKIAKLRESRSLSIRKMANIIGISDTALAKIEKGKNENIKIDTGIKIAKALDVSFNELFEIEMPSAANEKKLEEEIKRLEEMVSQQNEMLELQGKMIKLYKEYDDKNALEFKKLESISAFSKELISGLPKGTPVEKVLEMFSKQTPEFLKKEFPDLSQESE